jgi:hypothetical protein
MAKRKAAGRTRSAKSIRKAAPKPRSAKRPTAKRPAKGKARAPKKTAGKKRRRKITPLTTIVAPPRPATARLSAEKVRRNAPRVAHLDRVRRTLDETVQTPPSSLDMDRHASAARTGRAEMNQTLRNHRGMSSSIAAGDVDVDVEDAYFTGEEAPGGDNPTPDQDVVDDIGKALGVVYEDAEELKASDKVVERDKHRWELDPASAEDYKDRD